MDSTLLNILNSGVGGAIEIITDKLVAVASSINVPGTVVLILGLIFSLALGVLGYKYIKLVATMVFAIAGYIIGSEVFKIVNAHFAWDLPGTFAYLAGIALMLILGYLAFKKFAYGLFGVAGVAGFLLAYFIYPSLFLAIAAGVVVAMVSMYFVRYAFVTIFSVSAGFLFMGMLSALIPTLGLISLTKGFVGKMLAMFIACAFVALQLGLTRNESTVLKPLGKKRVKIRRVFDTW